MVRIEAVVHYAEQIRRGQFVAQPASLDTQRLLKFHGGDKLQTLVPERKLIGDKQTRLIGQHSCELSIGIARELSDARTFRFNFAGRDISITTGLVELRRDTEPIYQEAPFQIQFIPEKGSSYLVYSAKLNFRTILVDGAEELAVCLDTIQKGYGGERMARTHHSPLSAQELERVKQSNKILNTIEGQLGLGIRELCFI